MREIGTGLNETKAQVQKLKGIPVLMRIDSGRGRTAMVSGVVEQVFPSIFTVKLSSGETRSFSYNDVHTKGVMFIKNNPDD